MPAKRRRKNRGLTPGLREAASEKIRVVIVDDHPLFRQGLRHAMEEDSRFEVVGEADDSGSAIVLILQREPDVVVLDVCSSGGSELGLVDVLKAKKCRASLVILTGLKDETIFNRAVNLGIKGYVLKKNPADEILNCISAVAKGEAYVSSSLTDFLLRRRSRIELLATRQLGLKDLTGAERRVIKLIAQGKTSKQIATELFISPRTVDSHRSHICDKLGLTRGLFQFALENRDALSQLD